MKLPERIEQFLNEGLAGKSDATKRGYGYALKSFADWLEGSDADLDTFVRSDVQFYVQYLEKVKKRSASGINRDFMAIKAFAHWQGRPDVVADIRRTKAPSITTKAPEWLTPSQRKQLIRDVDRAGNKRDYAIVMTLLGCGLRVSELVALNRDDVVMSERKGTIIVRSGKGGKQRIVPVPSETRRAIERYLEERTDDNEALFLSNRRERISVRTVQNMLQQYGVHPHQLRHTYVKGLVDAGTPLATIMSLTGHTRAEMVAWYSTPSEDEKQAVVERLFLD
ncbi:tyrosine-type recombinase/integrase [Parageobacillus thermoglucosidasius]|uniref:tyrosine-type recombinase/integrase n=1 Tax=Parageobacillus thermoglucosidasius TaxID=1426 RepID=UPI0027F62622|nr:tyrosine recombinase XerA [Parageobacillus thermoglucosidasius]